MGGGTRGPRPGSAVVAVGEELRVAARTPALETFPALRAWQRKALVEYLRRRDRGLHRGRHARRRQDHLRPADRRRAARRRHRRGGHRGRPDRAPEDPVGARPPPGSASSSTPPSATPTCTPRPTSTARSSPTPRSAWRPQVHRRRTMTRRTLVILDEIHHAGDSRSWGDGVKAAFEPAVRRLMLTGTPFRSDDNPIPFVSYERGGDGLLRSRADSVYGYADALRDGVVRPVLFLAYSGRDPVADQRRRGAGRPPRRADDPGPGRAGLAYRPGPGRRLDAAGAAGRRRPADRAAQRAGWPTPAV